MNEACPMPRDPGDESGAMCRMLGARRIAVVGLSPEPQRPSHYVSQYMAEQGCEIIPVNPKYEEVMGKRCLKSLSELDRTVDVVLVFRRSEYCARVAEEAAAAKALGIWLQSGIRSEEAKRIAREAGMEYVEDRCMMVEHMRRGT